MFSCSNKEDIFNEKTEDYKSLVLQVEFPFDFFDKLEFEEIKDKKFLTDFIDESYFNQDEEYRLYEGLKYKINEKQIVLFLFKSFGNGKMLIAYSFVNGILVDTKEIAGNCCDVEYSCLISGTFKFTISASEVQDTERYRRKITKEIFSINKEGRFTSDESPYVSISEIIPKFQEVHLPYNSIIEKNDDEIITEEDFISKEISNDKYQQVTKEDIFMLNNIMKSDILDDEYIHYYAHYINFYTNAYWGITLLFEPKDYTEFGGFKEYLLLFRDDEFITSFDLYYNENIFGETNAKLFVRKNTIYIRHEAYKYSRYAQHFYEEDCLQTFYRLDENNIFEKVEVSEIFEHDSFEYFYALSKQQKEIPKNFLKYIRMYKDEELIKNMEFNENNLTIKSVCHFHINKNENAFIYYLKDETQNTFLYNKYNNSGELIECSPVLDCMSGTCVDFKVSKINVFSSKWCEIESKHAAGNFMQYTYFSDNKTRFSTSEYDYSQHKDNKDKEYFYRVMCDSDIYGLVVNNDVPGLLKMLKAETNTNKALEYNIERLEN